MYAHRWALLSDRPSFPGHNLEILIERFGVPDTPTTPEDIDWDAEPYDFVLLDLLGGGDAIALAVALEGAERTKAVGVLANYPGIADRSSLPSPWIELVSPITLERLDVFVEAIKETPA